MTEKYLLMAIVIALKSADKPKKKEKKYAR